VTDSHPASHPPSQPASHVAVAITLNAKASSLKGGYARRPIKGPGDSRVSAPLNLKSAILRIFLTVIYDLFGIFLSYTGIELG